MKTKLLLYPALLLVLLGCSLFSNLTSSSPDSEAGPTQDLSLEGWLLSNPAAGLVTLESYHQQLTISFRGTRDGAAYEWINAYQRDVWAKQSADFLILTTSETGLQSGQRLIGKVGQASYSRTGEVGPCEVQWGEAAPDANAVLEPASFLPPIEQGTEAGTETLNNVSARHYTVSEEKSGAKITGEFWVAETGGYVVRYTLTISGGKAAFGEGIEGEQRYEYELSRINALGEVTYPEGCSAVLTDFPVMDGARDIQRLPASVDYIISAQPANISQFYQDQLTVQGWTFVAAHDKDPKNIILVFTNAELGQAASILLNSTDSDVWVSANLRPWSAGSEVPTP